MNNGIRIRNIEPQEITIEGAGTIAGITNVYVNGVDVTVGTKAYVIVPTKTSELTNDSGFITSYTETDPTVPAYVKAISLADINAWNDKQNLLVSGTNIKTINGNSILGSGNLEITNNYTAGYGINIDVDNVISNTITSYNDLTDLPTIPTTTGELINTSGFINNTVNDLTNYIRADLLEDILPSVSDSGTELYLQDTAPYKLHLELNPSEIGQFTTTGKNLINIENFEPNQDRVNFSTIQNTITITALSSGTYRFGFNKIENLNIGDNYVVSFSSYTETTTNLAQWGVADSNGTFYGGVKAMNNTTSITFTPTETSVYIRIGYLSNSCSINDAVTVNELQVESGSTATSYEEYTGGIPAPNPDYPQDIHTITDENSVTIANKNLFDINTMSKGRLDNGVVGYDSNTTSLILNNNDFTFTTNTYWRGAVTDYIKVSPNTSYFFNSLTESIPSIISIIPAYYDENNTYIQDGTVSYPDNYSRLFTTTANTYYIRIGFQIKNPATITFEKPQLERGTTATSYIPHEERTYLLDLTSNDIELTKISTQWGDYENFIFKNSLDSPWYDSNYAVNSYVYGSRVFKYTLSSDDNWELLPTGVFSTTVNYSQLGTTKHYAVCNYFQDYNDVNDPTTDSWIMTQGNSVILHFNSSLNINTVSDLETWLDNNEVVFYAIRGGLGDYNSYNQAIEYSLQSQWFNAANSIGYDGDTNITQENFDRPFDLSAKTIQKVTN